jgi:hypothetical protein
MRTLICTFLIIVIFFVKSETGVRVSQLLIKVEEAKMPEINTETTSFIVENGI